MIRYMINNTKEGNTYNCDVYSRLLEERIIFIDEEITNQTASYVIAQLLHLETLDSNKDITIYINSRGGDVSSGLAIIDTMNLIKCDIKVIAVGVAASMAAIILASGTKGKRCCLKNSDILIHGVRNNNLSGTYYDIKINVDRMEEINERIIKILSKTTNHNINQINKDISRDKWLNAKEALKYGIIDEIL